MCARRRFFSFSLRSLLIATALVAGVIGWLVQQWRIVEDRRQTAEALEDKFGGEVFIWEGAEKVALTAGRVKGIADITGAVDVPVRPFQIPVIRRLLGDEPCRLVIIWTNRVSKSEADAIAAKFPESVIWRMPSEPGID